MASPTKLLDAQNPRKLGSRKPVVTIGEADKASGAWAGRRLLSVNGRHAFELGFWCGTCPLLFERLEGANETLSIADLQLRLNDGIPKLEADVISSFSALLPKGEYLPVLLEIEPALIYPMRPGDYFAEEQDATWKSSEGFWGLPENPRTPYYRTDTRKLDGDHRLFEFVVPMVPPSWNDPSRVSVHAQQLKNSARPTSVAFGVLDVRQRAVASTPEEALVHWGLTHFLLDGHHKLEAAANSGARLQLLSLISIGESLAERSQIERLVTIFEQTR